MLKEITLPPIDMKKFSDQAIDSNLIIMSHDFNVNELVIPFYETTVFDTYEAFYSFQGNTSIIIQEVYNTNNEKIGYVSMALDHKHVREFTDTANPTGKNEKQNISDATLGNYAFMWDYEGKNISHPRDYSIVGYDKNTGEKAMPWLSADLAEKYYASNQNINEFLKSYPIFEEVETEVAKDIPEDDATSGASDY